MSVVHLGIVFDGGISGCAVTLKDSFKLTQHGAVIGVILHWHVRRREKTSLDTFKIQRLKIVKILALKWGLVEFAEIGVCDVAVIDGLVIGPKPNDQVLVGAQKG